ncbi:MAG: nucleotidyltransferase domain-containing protein [Candidatus Woesearchaeota archaeon]
MRSTSSSRNSGWQNTRLVSYASSFVSFVLFNMDLGMIRNIILFGSVARMEAGEESDVDIFIDGDVSDKEADALVKRFCKTESFQRWKMHGIANDIKVMHGNLEEWKDLNDSIILDGITLYGKYRGTPSGGRLMSLFSWEDVKPNSNRVLFNKRLFGFSHYEYRYKGMLEKYGGKKLGKGSIMVPYESHKEFLLLFKRHKVDWSLRKVLEMDI